MPKYPIYYIASIIEAILGYLSFRFYKNKPKGWLRLFGSLFFLICFLMPIIFHNIESDVLWQTGGSELWFLFAGISLSIYEYIKKYKSEKQHEEEIREYKQVTKFLFCNCNNITMDCYISYIVVYVNDIFITIKNKNNPFVLLS